METTRRTTSPRLSRRALLGGAAGAAGIVAGIGGGRSALARPAAGARFAVAAGRADLGGRIVVSFADEGEARAAAVAGAAEAVRGANPGAEIEVDHQAVSESEYATRLFLAMRTGRAPDVFHLNGAAIGALAAGEVIRPLDELLAAWPDWQFYPQPVRDAVTYEGRVWALPYGLDTHFLFYRRDVFERAGLPRDWEPADVAAILEAARTVKENVPGVIPYAIYGGEVGGTATAVVGFVPLLFAHGGSFLDQDRKWIIDSPAIRQTFSHYARAFLDEQLVPPQVLTTPNPGQLLRQRLGEGELAIMFENAAAYGPWRDADPQAVEENIGYLLHPTADGGPSFTVGGSGGVWFIAAGSEHPDLAWEFVKTLNAKETVAALDLADPHPAARTDAAELPAYQADPFLVAATASLQHARFNPPSPHYLDLIPIVQKATGLVATGEADPEEAAARYAADLERVLGADNVVSQA